MQIQSNYLINFHSWNVSPVAFQGKTSAIKTEVVLDRLEKKIPVRQIAAEFGIGLDTFYKMLRERNIPYNQQKVPKRLAHITKEKIEELLSGGTTIPQICEQFKITQSVYYNLAERLGVVHPKKLVAMRLSEITKNEFLDCLNSGMSVDEICKHLKITSSGYYSLIKKFNVKTAIKESIEKIKAVKKEDIVRLLQEGKSNTEIAKILRIKDSMLTSLIAKFGIETKHIKSRRNIALITKEKLQELVSSGKSVKEICEVLNIPERSYSRLVRQFGVITERQKARKHLASITRETIQALVDEGLSVSEISKRLKVNNSTFYRLLKQLKVNYIYVHHNNEIVIPKHVLQAKAKSGETTKEISDSLGIAPTTYHLKARAAEVKTVLRDSIDTLDNISFEEFQSVVNKCKSVKEICETLHITKANYFALMHKYKVETPYRRAVASVAATSAEQIRDMRATGKSVRDICLELHISEGSYHRILRKAADENLPA